MDMNKKMMAAVSVAAFFGSVSIAAAGAYGEVQEPVELPAPPPAPVAPAPAPVPAPMPVVESGPDYARTGFYLIGAATYAIEDFDVDSEYEGETAGVFSEGFNFDDTWGFNVRGGYRAHPNLAVEIEYEQYDDFLDSRGADLEAWSLTANAKIYALTGCIQPFALLGAGIAEFEASDSKLGSGDADDFVARAGLGTDVYITENLAITTDASYMFTTGDIDDFDFVALSLGAMWRF